MKQTIILRGLPGSGKSFLSRRLERSLGGKFVQVSADNFFMKRGGYVFDPERIGEAHAECFREFAEAVMASVSTIIVDNTNCHPVDVVGYVRMAEAHGYDIRIIHLPVDFETSMARNIHDVPEEKVRRMHAEFYGLPGFYGKYVETAPPKDEKWLNVRKRLDFLLSNCSDCPKSLASGVARLAEDMGIQVDYKHPRFWGEEDE